jgi:hypothetical protein
MTYFFQERLGHLGSRMGEVNTEDVTLGRTGQTPITGVPASPILTEAEEIVPGVAVTRIEKQLWGIDVADYAFGGSPVIPESGDTVTRADGSVFRVVSADGDPPFTFTTSTRDRYLIQTERTGDPT